MISFLIFNPRVSLNTKYKHHISLLPKAMNVTRVIYSSEEAWGFGPGGNETGIIVYEMPKNISNRLKKNGLKYLKTLRKNIGNNGRGRFVDWYPTPMLIHERDKPLEVENSGQTRGIRDYLFRYGFQIPLDPKIEGDVNEAILKVGNYFSYGRSGVIILIPQLERIVYMYSG